MKKTYALILVCISFFLFVGCQSVPASHTLDTVINQEKVIAETVDTVSDNNKSISDDLSGLEKVVPAAVIETVKAIEKKVDDNQILIDKQLKPEVKQIIETTTTTVKQVSTTENNLVVEKKANGTLTKWVVILGLIVLSGLAGVGFIIWKKFIKK